MTRSTTRTDNPSPGMFGDTANFPASNLPAGPAGPATAPGAAPQDGGPARTSVTVASYPDYASAQRAVDRLSDNRFPVERTAIVGTNLRLVEEVTGRLTTGRAALAGAGTGAWFGLFIGLLIGIFAVVNWLGIIVTAVVIGAVWGAVFGAVAHAMTGGRRDFSSRSLLQASQYGVTVDAEYADRAHQVLRESTQPAGHPSR
ncbi:general stress protein [Solwaraspora sp. WMMB762]|uniref:general stress protein n=1 Tax=Solwaraspora sp. WMMB762 TaxID=3404120 RepID=UPI003B92DAAD